MKPNRPLNVVILFAVMVLIIMDSLTAQAQPAGTSNCYTRVKDYNLAALWHAKNIKLLSLKETERFPEPYGTLGKNYQRFYIHYTSVIKDPSNLYCYHVKGKTRVGTRILLITGTITVMQAGIYKPASVYAPDTYKGYKRGQIISKVVFNESGTHPGTVIKGELTTHFCINAQNQLLYDTLDFGIDGYGNNYFTGTLTNHTGKEVQNLQYGDYNLSGSPFSDVGGITVPSQYEKYGWQSFVDAIPDDLRPANKAAIAEEKRQWWNNL